MEEIFHRAKRDHIGSIFAEVSITAKPFFEKYGFLVLSKQTVVKNGVEFVNYKMEKIKF